MEQKRQMLWIWVIAMTMMLLWVWQKDQVNAAHPTTVPTAQPLQGVDTDLSTRSLGDDISIKTDVLQIKIGLSEGELTETALTDYRETLEKNSPPLKIFSIDPERYAIASTAVYRGKEHRKIMFTADRKDYALAEGQNELVVTLRGECDGVQIIRTFTFHRGSYEVGVKNEYVNPTLMEQSFEIRKEFNKKFLDTHSKMGANTFNGISFSTEAKPYEKRTYDKINNEVLYDSVSGGWIAIQQPFFMAAWILDPQFKHQWYSVSDKSDRLGTVGARGVIQIPAQGTITLQEKMYLGPEKTELLKAAAPHLELAVDYGVLWFIASLLFWIMKKIHQFIPNWGVAILGVTLLIKLVFYRLSEKSYVSMNKLKDLQPKILALRDRYASDPQKLSLETLALYRQEKVNPMGGCLPVLIQIPVFMALYWVLVNSVELRQAPFMLWIKDLSDKDPFYVLPVLMMGSMFVQQRLSPPAQDPVQQKMMYFMPLFFGFLFMNFPSGLVLYWLVNNVLSIAQQWWIMNKHFS